MRVAVPQLSRAISVTLSSVLRRAVRAGELTENPVRRVDKPRIDRRCKVRFLDQAEESRLRDALKARDEEMQNRRTAANERRQKRHKDLLPRLTHFGDHLTPAVLLSMNTGLRRGEVLKLRWACVDFDRRLLIVEGRNAKNRQTRHVPLNEEAMSALRRWREQSGSGTRFFDVATGFRTAWEKLLKRATITRFRWHDLRHHFASRLVQHGVPLNTVRDLLGHSSVAMSLALCPPGARPTARGRSQTQRKAASCAYPALTVGWLSGGESLPH